MSDADVEPGEFVEDGSIVWTGRNGLVAATVGTILSLLGYWLASSIDLLRGGVNTIVSGYGSWYATLISTPISSGTAGIMSSIPEAESALSSWGVLAFPVAVAVTIVSASLILWGVSRFGW